MYRRLRGAVLITNDRRPPSSSRLHGTITLRTISRVARDAACITASRYGYQLVMGINSRVRLRRQYVIKRYGPAAALLDVLEALAHPAKRLGLPMPALIPTPASLGRRPRLPSTGTRPARGQRMGCTRGSRDARSPSGALSGAKLWRRTAGRRGVRGRSLGSLRAMRCYDGLAWSSLMPRGWRRGTQMSRSAARGDI